MRAQEQWSYSVSAVTFLASEPAWLEIHGLRLHVAPDHELSVLVHQGERRRTPNNTSPLQNALIRFGWEKRMRESETHSSDSDRHQAGKEQRATAESVDAVGQEAVRFLT